MGEPFVMEGDLEIVREWEYGPSFEMSGQEISDRVADHFELTWDDDWPRDAKRLSLGKVRIMIERLA